MAKKKPSQSKSLGLGMGLDALIKSKTKSTTPGVEAVEEKPVKKPTPKNSKPKPKPKAKTTKKEKVQPKKPGKTQVNADEERVVAVSKVVKNNPRITLWSAQSAAVLRYLKKTQPEFSISKEASKLIDSAVKEKYPEIWDLFQDI